MTRPARPVGPMRGGILVELDADGFAVDPTLRPITRAVTDAATRTRRGRVVCLSGWTRNRPDLHCTALWVAWSDTPDRVDYYDDLSVLVARDGYVAAPGHRSAVPVWDAVYAERLAAQTAGE